MEEKKRPESPEYKLEDCGLCGKRAWVCDSLCDDCDVLSEAWEGLHDVNPKAAREWARKKGNL